MKVVVMNAAVGAWYPAGQERLRRSLEANRGHIRFDIQLWNGSLPPRCPPHSRVPYAFKPYAYAWAISHGYDIAIWFDASMWATRSIDPIIEHADRLQVSLWKAGFSVGEWTHDRGLGVLNITRDEAMKVPLLCGGITAFNLNSPVAMGILSAWYRHAQDGVSFPGAWDNTSRSCSQDQRCLGHRHDMPTLSVMAARHGVQSIDPPKWFAYSTDADPAHPEAIILARGM